MCTFSRPSCVHKPSLANESEVSSPSNRRGSAYVRVVVLGVPRRAVFWAEKLGSSAGASAFQASGRHRTTLVRDAHCRDGSASWWVACKLQRVSYHFCCQAMERCSDGGEDQGAEEAFIGQKKEESSRQFWKEPSRACGSSFPARPGPSRPSNLVFR